MFQDPFLWNQNTLANFYDVGGAILLQVWIAVIQFVLGLFVSRKWFQDLLRKCAKYCFKTRFLDFYGTLSQILLLVRRVT